ncbi:MAG TPA: TonB family protein [Gammaproteobacteria bacterium]
MSATNPAERRGHAKQSDLLLWVSAALVAILGGTWLAISKPWATDAGDAPAMAALPTPAAQSTQTAAAQSTQAPDPAPERRSPDVAAGGEPGANVVLDSALDNPLRMAELALEAGMLVEPEEYSAWGLFSQVLANEPDNQAARQGLMKVADELVRRAHVALEQGRFGDARAAVDRILAALPAHDGALALASSLPAPQPEPEAQVARARPAPPPEPEEPAVEQPAPAPRAPEPPPPDPLVTNFEAFEQAMAANRLLTPLDESAKHYANQLYALDPNHVNTRLARERLSREFLSRSRQALEALDTDAATTWIDEAELLGADPSGVEAAREAVVDKLAEMEAARPLPASELKVTNYVAPEYPERAAARGLEGWVDIEFTVAADGTTKDVTVTDASHETFFRREAAEAVERWQFEPRVFMDRVIEQRAFTRIRFVL